MHRVKVSCDKLIAVVTVNRDKHRAEAQEAKGNYRRALIDRLQNEIDSLVLLPDDNEPTRQREFFKNLPEPMDMTGEYDRAIRMLEMSVEDDIELTEQEFCNLVMDEWDWKVALTASNSRYLR